MFLLGHVNGTYSYYCHLLYLNSIRQAVLNSFVIISLILTHGKWIFKQMNS